MEEQYPIHRAAAEGKIEAFKRLLRHQHYRIFDCHQNSNDNKMPLMLAIKNKRSRIVEYIFEKAGLNGTPQGNDHFHQGTTLAWWLAFYGEWGTLMLLVDGDFNSLDCDVAPTAKEHPYYNVTLSQLMEAKQLEKPMKTDFWKQPKRPADQDLNNPAPEKKPRPDEGSRSPSPSC